MATKDEITRLIELLEKHESLWRVDFEDYKDRDEKRLALERISGDLFWFGKFAQLLPFFCFEFRYISLVRFLPRF